jgi:hypothetical protein
LGPVANASGSNGRRAFTLFEVILAIAMSVVLISALYLALSMHYRLARSGREIIDETAVTRFVVKRITQDIDCQLSAIDPRLQGNNKNSGNSSSGNGGSSPSTTSTTITAAGITTNTTTGNSGSSPGTSSSNPSSSSSSNSSTNSTVVFNLGVYGDSNHLVLTGRSVPRDLTQAPGSTPSQTSDLRRVTYWLAGGGLARQEIRLVTGTDATASSPPALPPAVGNPEAYIIAPQVKQFSLEYYDGNTWQSSWDGSTADATTGYPIGPPMAIAFTVTLQLPDHGRDKGKEVTYRHVVAIAAANNQGQTASQPQTQGNSP